MQYELGIGIQSRDLVWTNGPFPAGRFADLTIFRLGLKQKLERAGERAEADLGYRGEAETIDLPDEGCFVCPQRQRKLKSLARSRHETVNGMLKTFGCLSQRYRHNLQKHKQCFEAVAVITQLGIENGKEPPFQIKGYKTQTIYN